MHSTLALLCIGAATSTAVVTGLRTTCVSMTLRHCHHWGSSPRAYVRPRDGHVFSEAPRSTDSRWRARSVWGVGGGSQRSSLRRGAAPDDEKSSQDWGGEDYSQYGYEPEYEMQDENDFSDQATLERWRHERLLANDRWQFGLYGKQAVGHWFGIWQEYVATDLGVEDDLDDEETSGLAPMIGLIPGSTFEANTRVTRRVIDSEAGKKVFVHAHELPDRDATKDLSVQIPAPVTETLFTDSFRGGNGTQVVGNTYTIAAERCSEDERDDIWVELGLRARDVRVRCLFQYGRDEEDGIANVQRVYLAREGLERLPLEDGVADEELYGAAGKGLYDVHPRSRSPLYFSIYAQGGLTIRFPLKVAAGDGGVFCVDWTARDIRYQADRSFDLLDGSCSRLEVIEIGTADSKIFLPEEKF